MTIIASATGTIPLGSSIVRKAARTAASAAGDADLTKTVRTYGEPGVSVGINRGPATETEADRATRILTGMRRTLSDVASSIDRVRNETKAQRKGMARQRIDRVRQQLQSLLRFSGDAKYTKQEAARLAKELAAAVREYANAGDGTGTGIAKFPEAEISTSTTDNTEPEVSDTQTSPGESLKTERQEGEARSQEEPSASDDMTVAGDATGDSKSQVATEQKNTADTENAASPKENQETKRGDEVAKTKSEAEGDLEVLKLVRKLKSVLKQLIEAKSEAEIDQVRSQALQDPAFDKMIARKQEMEVVTDAMTGNRQREDGANSKEAKEAERKARKAFDEIDHFHDAIWSKAWSALMASSAFAETDRSADGGDAVSPPDAPVAEPEAGASPIVEIVPVTD